MRAAKTNVAEKLQGVTLPGIKVAANPATALDAFLSQMKSELTLPDALGGAALQAGGKKKICAAAADVLSLVKGKGKQTEKVGHETALAGDAKSVDGAVSLAGIETIAVQVSGVADNVQPANAPKKVLSEANPAAIKSVPNAAQPMQQIDMAVNGPVEIAAAKQMEEAPALESKTKHGAGSAIAGLGAKTVVGVANADGSAAGFGLNGLPVGGVAGQAMQGGHSSGASGHKDQGSHPTAAATPQIVASSPSQLDVGVYDDTHGWLRIRAELGAGGTVNASLTSAAAAHESLRTALPEMTHYLGSESVNVNSIALHKFGDTSGGQPGSHGEAQQQSSMAGQHSTDGEQQTGGQTHAMVTALEETANRSVDAAPDVPDAVGIEAVGAVSGQAAVTGLEQVDETAPVDGSAIDAIGTGEQVDALSTQVLPWQMGYGGSGGWLNVSA